MADYGLDKNSIPSLKPQHPKFQYQKYLSQFTWKVISEPQHPKTPKEKN